MEKRNKYFIYKRDAHMQTHTHTDIQRESYTLRKKQSKLFCTLREMGKLVRTVKNKTKKNSNLAKNSSPPRPLHPTDTHTHTLDEAQYLIYHHIYGKCHTSFFCRM